MATKLRGTQSPTMHEMADQMHPVDPPATTPYTASPSDYDARKIQRNIMQDGKPPKFTGKGTRGAPSIGNPFTAIQTVVKNMRTR